MKKTHIGKIAIFTILIGLSLSFLIFQKGIWLYLDASYYPLTISKSIEYIYTLFSTIQPESFFGFDNSFLHTSRFLHGFISTLPQILIYGGFFLGSFFSFYLLLQQPFSKQSSFRGALLYTFNPVSVYLLNQTGFLYVYLSLPLVLLSIHQYFNKDKVGYLFLSLLGFQFLSSYPRLTGLYSLSLFFLGLFFYKWVLHTIIRQKRKTIIFVASHLLFFLPVLFSFLSPYISGDKEYFQGIENHAQESVKHANSFFKHHHGEFLPTPLIIREISLNFGGSHQQKILFKILGLILTLGIVSWSTILIYKKETKNRPLAIVILMILLLSVLSRASAFFLPEHYFIQFTYIYFPFLASNLLRIYCIYVISLSFLLTYNIEYTTSNYLKKGSISFLFLYIISSIFPLVNYRNNVKLKTINTDTVPKEYKDTIRKNRIGSDATLFYPSTTLHHNWSPYMLPVQYGSQYRPIFMDNPRLVNNKQATLYKKIDKLGKTNDIQNNILFNLKHIFISNDIQDVDDLQFDYFPSLPYVAKSKEYNKIFTNHSQFHTISQNKHLTHVTPQDSDQYEYFLYAPWTILRKNINQFFSGNTITHPEKKYINIDPDSFHKPDYLNTFEMPLSNKDIQITYKRSTLQPTKIYLKIEKYNTKKPFLLQLNQTFGLNRKIKRITKKEFNEKGCMSSYYKFGFTQNKYCNYKPNTLELMDIKYLRKTSIPESQHFEGNFIGNARIIHPWNLPKNTMKNESLYAIIIYEKEVRYDRSILLSSLTLVLTLFRGISNQIKNMNKT